MFFEKEDSKNYSVAFSTDILYPSAVGCMIQSIFSPLDIPRASTTILGTLDLYDEYSGFTSDIFVVALMVFMPPIFLLFSISMYFILPFLVFIFLYVFTKNKAKFIYNNKQL